MSYDPERIAVVDMALDSGFSVYGTGGGCGALFQEVDGPDSPYLLLTHSNDPSLPSLEGPVSCGLYVGEESEAADFCTFKSLRDALDGARDWAESGPVLNPNYFQR